MNAALLFIAAALVLALALSYFMLPPIWRYARENRLFSQSDFFVRKYESPVLGIIVSLVGIVALVPYLVLQLKGLGIIVETASYGAISRSLAIWIGAVAECGPRLKAATPARGRTRRRYDGATAEARECERLRGSSADGRPVRR